MKREYSVAVVGCAAFLCAFAAGTERALGQEDTWTLGFEAPDSFSGNAGDSKSDTGYNTMTHAGPGANAQGWSYGAVCEGCAFSDVTLTGTASEIAYTGGFDATELVTEASNPGVASGMVSAVVLHLKKGTTLEANTTQRIARFTLTATIPDETDVARLLYKENLIGSGEPVPIVVTQGGDSKTASLSEKEVNLRVIRSCCSEVANVGFSGARVSGPPGTGVIDGDPSLCLASGGELIHESGAGNTGVAQIYGNITSNIAAGGGIQGWSYGIAVSGDGNLVPGSATLTGTYAEIAYVGGFDATELILPENQVPPGQNGLVSAVVLHLKKGTTLPLIGTESVVTFQVAANAPQDEDEQVVNVKYQADLIGSGEPVPLVITIGGDSASACNFGDSNVAVRFRLTSEKRFLRGDGNGDPGLDIGDPIFIINELFRQGPMSPCRAAEDANDDGVVDAADATFLIDYLFRGQSAPPGLGVCGADPTPSDLPCDVGC